MRANRSFAALALLGLALPAFGAATYTYSTWALIRSGSQVSAHATYEACDAAMKAQPQPSVGSTITYRCQRTITARGVADAPPPPPPPPVTPAPTVNLDIQPRTLPAGGGSITSTWSSSNATSCASSGQALPTSGTGTATISATQTFMLTCTGAGGSTSASVTVTVGSAPPPPPPGDRDGDGVPDASDACPDVPASTATGCPQQPPPPTGGAQGLTDSKPVTAALTGTRTYHVRSMADANSVPWADLASGDVVNVYYSATPYKLQLAFRAQATDASPVVINGVTDAQGNRPVFDCSGTLTRPASGQPAWRTSEFYGLGCIVIARGVAQSGYGAYGGAKPSNIQFRNLQVQNGGSKSCFYEHVGDNVLYDNIVATGCAFGIFTMAKDELLSEAASRTTVRNSRLYGNGTSGSDRDHNAYIQSDQATIEGTYFGRVRSGALGSSFKDRSARLIFRNNYVECSARCIDVVHSENQSQGISARSYYGVDYVYGNKVFSAGPEVLHLGGDNLGEATGSGTFTAPAIYRDRLFYWNNEYTLTGSNWRGNVFDLSARTTEVYAWNSKFALSSGITELSWLQFAGQLKLGTGITVSGKQPVAAWLSAANDGRYSVQTGATIPNDPFLQTLQ